MTIAAPAGPASQPAPAVSVVVPVFDEEAVLPLFLPRMRAALEGLGEPWELILVDDGSRDGTLAILRALAAADPARLRYRSLSRNFGHQVAVSAGLDAARGEAVVVIDADLQDPPELVPAMIRRLREAPCDVVYARRRARAGESLAKRWSADLFYRVLRRFTDVEIPADTGDFRAVTRRVVEVLRRMPERHKFLRGQVAWVGFRQEAFLYDRAPRAAGGSGYSWRTMLRLAADALVGFSNLPLRLASYLGFAVSGVAAVLMVYTLWSRLVSRDYQPGWASLMMSLLFLGGVQLIAVGIIGEYLARLGDNVRGRPLYVVGEESERPPEAR